MKIPFEHIYLTLFLPFVLGFTLTVIIQAEAQEPNLKSKVLQLENFVKDKDLEIRNLRRRLFDLEKSAANTAQGTPTSDKDAQGQRAENHIEKINKLMAENEALATKVNALSDQARSLAQQANLGAGGAVGQLQSEVDRLNGITAQLKHEIDEKKQTIDQLNKRIETRDIDSRDLSERIKDRDKEYALLQNEKEKLKGKLIKVEEEKVEIKQELELKESELNKNEGKLKKLEALEKQLAQLNDKMSEVEKGRDQAVAKLNTMIQKLTTQKDEAIEKQAESTRLVQSLEEQIKSFAVQADQAQKNSQEALKAAQTAQEGKVSELTARMAEINDQLSKKDEEIAQLSIDTGKTSEKFQGERMKYADDIKLLTELASQKENALTELSKRVEQQKEDISAQSAMLQAHVSQIARLEKENYELKQKGVAMAASSGTLAKAKEGVNQELSYLQNNLMEMKRKVDERENTIRALEADRQKLVNELAYLKKSKGEEATALDETRAVDQEGNVNDKVKKLNAQLKEEKAKAKILKEDNHLAKLRLEQLSNNLAKKVEESRNPLLAEISMLNQRIYDLESQLRDVWNSTQEMLVDLKNQQKLNDIEKNVFIPHQKQR